MEIEFLFFALRNFGFNKRNDHVATFKNAVSEHRRVSTTKYSTSTMILGVVASNGKKMPLVWCERGYRQTSAAYKENLETKVLPWVKKIPKKSNYVLQQDGAQAHTAIDCAGLIEPQHELLVQKILATAVTRFEPSRLQPVGTH